MLNHSARDVRVVEKENRFVGGKERLDGGTGVLIDAGVRDQEIEGVHQCCRLVDVIDDTGRETPRVGGDRKPAIERQLLVRRQIKPRVLSVAVETGEEDTVEAAGAATSG